MAARSNDKEDVYEWIWNIIVSCETNDQHYASAKLIMLFKTQYNDMELVNMLINRRMVVWDELYSQYKKGILKG